MVSALILTIFWNNNLEKYPIAMVALIMRIFSDMQSKKWYVPTRHRQGWVYLTFYSKCISTEPHPVLSLIFLLITSLDNLSLVLLHSWLPLGR